ncbi:zinc ABC transporter substrate-binding protein AztC [Nocardia mangyaensis]|uniref:zinc ABC transporter substrate-binding protein AztC n=1 Tax=Nocardia mangyaensis TaxID=2213200 RepID=UPI00267610EC|nr:zinc ABC transporter substrate-binding protein AztC [Nocardia mangyaensis]MDO3648638.1 zinc ABC transporter substrate-binding protein AztC [Nocardia mangyaensis]
MNRLAVPSTGRDLVAAGMPEPDDVDGGTRFQVRSSAQRESRVGGSRRVIRTVFALVGTLAVLGSLVACSSTGDRAGIVVTTNILGDLTRAVVGDTTPVTVLMQSGADPHSFAISAREAAEIERSALVVHNGLGLEEGVARHVQAADDAGVPTLAVAERVNPIEYAADESAGRPDPHFWTDPQRVRLAVEAISAQVIDRVPGIDANAVRDNTDRYLDELDQLDRWMADRFAAIAPERRKLVTDHHVFGYLAQRFGLQVIGAVIPSGTTLASPSASDLDDLAGAIRAAGVGAIFADSGQPDRLSRVLAEHTGLQIQVIALHTESLSAPGGGADTYLEMARTNTEAITRGLTGQSS